MSVNWIVDKMLIPKKLEDRNLFHISIIGANKILAYYLIILI